MRCCFGSIVKFIIGIVFGCCLGVLFGCVEVYGFYIKVCIIDFIVGIVEVGYVDYEVIVVGGW